MYIRWLLFAITVIYFVSRISNIEERLSKLENKKVKHKSILNDGLLWLILAMWGMTVIIYWLCAVMK